MSSKLFIFLLAIYAVRGSIRSSNAPDPSSRLSAVNQLIISQVRAMLEEHWPWKTSFDDQLLRRFFNSKDFNVENALQALKDHLIWRKAFNVDNILDEDWGDLEELYPYDIMVSYPSRKQDPVVLLQIHLGEWGLFENSEFLDEDSLKSERMITYATAKMMEDADRRARSLASPDNDPKFNVLVNLDGLMEKMTDRVGVANRMRGIVQLFADQWKEATGVFLFINVPHVPNFACSWSAEGELVCPSKYSKMVDKQKFDLGGMEFY